MNLGPPPADDSTIPPGEGIQWRAAKQLRRERPGWLVIWVPMTSRFHAYPMSGRRGGTTLTGATTEELAARIDEAEADRRRPRGRGDPRSITQRWEGPSPPAH